MVMEDKDLIAGDNGGKLTRKGSRRVPMKETFSRPRVKFTVEKVLDGISVVGGGFVCVCCKIRCRERHKRRMTND